VMHQPPLPPGHPDGDEPLAASQRKDFEQALEQCRERTRTAAGLSLPTTHTQTDSVATPATATDAPATGVARDNHTTTLPLVAELPGRAMYEPQPHALVCTTCGANRDPTFQGLLETLSCHGDLAEIDRTAVPPVALGLTLTAEEIAAAPVEERLLCALQLIANIARSRYHDLAVDLVHDSPHAVLELFGIDAEDIQTLADADLITIDKLGGYSYYTLTTDGQRLLQQPNRKGTEWGHRTGDLTETLLHQAMVEALRRYAVQTAVADPESPVTRVEPYFELHHSPTADTVDLDGGTRFDLVGLDAAEHIRLIGEAERHNNDASTAALRDYDQIATIAPDTALWAVPSSTKGHKAVLGPLADPPANHGAPRIDGYSTNTRIPTISGIDRPGMDEIFTLNELRKHLTSPTLEATALSSPPSAGQ